MDTTNPESTQDTSSTSTDGVAYLALGDSYTIGESVAETERFPQQLAVRLVAEGFSLREVNIIARTGWTTDELLSGILKANLSDTTYNLVSLLIGVNNQYRGRSLENYQEEFTTLLLRAIQLAGNRPERVLVLSIPDYGVTPFISNETKAQQIAREIDSFNAAAAQICMLNRVQFLNITSISRHALNDRSLIASDGLHPSGKMYAKWVELMWPKVQEIVDG